MTEKYKSLLILNGAGLLVVAALSGWLHFIYLLEGLELWPFIDRVDVKVPGEHRAWVMAHLEGITNGLVLFAVAASANYIMLSAKLMRLMVYSTLTFAWLFTLPAIANAWFGTRGLAMGGGPFGASLANDLIFLAGWPAFLGVHIALPLLLWGTWKHYRQVGSD